MARKKSEQPEQDLPEIVTMGIHKVDGGWAFIKITTKGDQVIKKEEGEKIPRSYCFMEFKTQAVREYLKEI